ncbi:hypothetical protein HOI83_02880, partial [Candidatus Uhrbacteria bacterium]|nr:hypothetical protein [Candidatus Uhrbacteria bacterium]
KPLPQMVALDPDTTREEVHEALKRGTELDEQDLVQFESDYRDHPDSTFTGHRRRVAVNADLRDRVLHVE